MKNNRNISTSDVATSEYYGVTSVNIFTSGLQDEFLHLHNLFVLTSK